MSLCDRETEDVDASDVKHSVPGAYVIIIIMRIIKLRLRLQSVMREKIAIVVN